MGSKTSLAAKQYRLQQWAAAVGCTDSGMSKQTGKYDRSGMVCCSWFNKSRLLLSVEEGKGGMPGTIRGT